MAAVTFTASAQPDLREAQSWYEERAPGLGDDLIGEIDDLVDRISDRPGQFPIVYKDARRALLRRFPYALFFRMTDAGAQVVAVFHTRRNPTRWRDRL